MPARARPGCATTSTPRCPPPRCARCSSTGIASWPTTWPRTAGAAESGLIPRVIAISGASGLVGSALSAFLTSGGHRVIRLVRRSARGSDERYWDPANPAPDLLSGVDAVIHLAGASIAGRFTSAHKRDIRDSRIEPTRRLAKAAADAAGGPSVFVTASAIGYYGFDRGEDVLTEHSARGDGFLADVVADWEAAAAPAEGGGLRVVAVRTGIVQAAQGRHAAVAAAAVLRGARRAAGQRPAVVVVDRHR